MMKKTVVMMSLFIFFVQGMESNSWSITSYGTKINLTKGSILDADGKVDVVVTGRNQQRLLVNANDWLLSKIGDCSYNVKRGLWIKNKEDDSASDGDRDNLFEHHTNYENINTKGHKIFFKKTTKSICINEPCIRYEQGSYKYSVDRPDPDYKQMLQSLLFYNDEAFKQATKDLDMCYTIVLEKVVLDLSEKKEKSIALHTLSTEVGFPRKKATPIAVSAVLEFIKNNFGAYDRIELFVKKRFEFDLYKELLIKGCKLPASIMLLYIAVQKDFDSSLQIFPSEIIYNIAKLVNSCLKDVNA